MFSCLRTLQFKKKDTLIVCLAALLFVLALAQWWYLPLTPTLGREVDYPYFITMDDRGNTYIVNQGKSEILKIGQDVRVAARLSFTDHGEDVFSEANEVAVDEDGNIYVQDVIWNETGLGLAIERIIRFDETGRFLDVVFENDYSGSMVMKRHLFSLLSRNGEICFAMVDWRQGRVCIYGVRNGQAELRQEFLWEDVENIQSIAIGNEGSVYLADKSGTVFWTDGKETETLYQVPPDTYIMPYYLNVSSDGTVYFTDICNQEIYQIRDGQAEVAIDTQKLETLTGDSLSASILETIRFCGEGDSEVLCMAFDDRAGYLNLSSGTYTGFGEFSYRMLYQALLVFRYIAFAFAGAVAVYYLIAILRYCVVSGLVAQKKTSLILMVAVIISAAVVMGSMLSQFRNIFIDEQLNSMCSVTQIAGSIIDPETMDSVSYPADYGNEDYLKLKQSMQDLIDVSSKYSENMYCNLVKVKNDRAYAFSYLDNSIGGYYPLDEGESAEAKEVYETGEPFINDGKSDATGTYVYVKEPIKRDDGQVVGIVEIGMVSDTLSAMVNDLRTSIMVEIILLVIIAVFVINECIAFFDDKRAWKERSKEQEGRTFPVHYFRLMVFFCFAAYNMPTSFLPVYIERFYVWTLPFSVELAGSLPLTLNFMMIGVMSLFCARVIRRLGFRRVAMLGGLCCMAGDLSMALAVNYWMAAGGLVLNGIGCGFIVNGLTLLVANQEKEEQTSGFSVMNGAMLSGMVCGTVVGATIAQELGPGRMFFFSAGIWFGILLVALFVGKMFKMTMRGTDNTKGAVRFLFSGKIMGFFLLMLIPYAVTNGFTSYFLPIFGDAYGLSESQTSLLLVMNCLVGIFLSGTLTQVMQKTLGRFAMYLSALLSLGAMALFGYFQNLYMLAFVLFVLGAARSFGGPIREIIFCGKKEVQSFGEDRAMGFYNFVDNMGDSLGTIVFGGILSIGFSAGIWALTGVSAAMAAVYEWFFGRREAKNS